MTWNPGDPGRAPDWAVSSFLTYLETGQFPVTALDVPPEAFESWALGALRRATNPLPAFHQTLLELAPGATVANAVKAVRDGARPPTWSR